MHRVNYTHLLFLSAFWLFAGHCRLFAQSADVNLAEVKILGSRKSQSTNGLHVVRIDSLLRTKYFGADLSRILREETNLNITQYGGEGSLSSLRLRGSAPSQTQISWNGIPVNSPTTGSIDLSLLTGGMADAIELAYGAGGALFGSGTFGGSVNLFNNPDWNNHLAANVMAEVGSWNHWKSGLGIRTGNEHLQYQMNALYQNSPNSYRYYNEFKPGNPVEYRINDSLHLAAVQQHLFVRLPKNWVLQYGFWAQDREKQLPSAESSAPAFYATQKDKSLRQFIRATKTYRRSSLEIVGAYFTDTLFYGEKKKGSNEFSRYSGIRSGNTYLSLYDRWLVSERLTLEGGTDFEYETAKTQAYGTPAAEYHGALFGLARYRFNHLVTNVSYRQVFYSVTGPKPLFAFSFQYQPFSNGLTVKGQISNKFRFPTLNDRYWLPGGNPELLPESGWGCDLGADWALFRGSNSGITIGSMLFIQNINNWIQWIPVGTYWSPENVRLVRCQGAEIDLTGRKEIGAIELTVKAMYSYTESIDMGRTDPESRLQGQLPYVPLNLLRLTGSLDWHGISASLSYKYAGKRYTTDDHDPWLVLEPYHLADFTAAYTLPVRSDRLMISGRISNLFNADYQMIRAFPAPGRAFYLSVNYLFNHKTDKDVKN